MKILKINVNNVWGEEGKLWLEKLPEIIKQMSNYWALNNINPVDNMSHNYVAKATQKNNKPVVLKISCDKHLIENEYKVLKHFNGEGSIKVIDIHKAHHALLLEQAIPGHLLKEQHPANISDTIHIYSDVVKHIASRSSPIDNYPDASKWCDATDRIEDARIEKRFIKKAKELKAYLLSSMDNKYLCHGDLHLENIIQHGKQWVSIDPKGIIGEIAFEAAAFDLLSKSDWNQAETIQNKLITRINLLASTLEIDKDRLLAWIFVRTIISAQWFIEDNGNPDERLNLASQIYPLLTKQYNKENVCLTYEKISDWYKTHRSKDLFEKPYLDKVISLIQPHGSVLDLGCGTGQPIAEYFIKKGFSVMGVDGSKAQIEKAKKFVPDMKAICSDMRNINLDRQFNCIIAWHSFFHLSKDDQRNMFKIFENHTQPGGILIFTSGPEESEVWSDNGGEILYHASLSASEYRSLLTRHHFDVLCHNIKDPDCGGATVWIAKKK